jgi:ACT domain-containing protein
MKRASGKSNIDIVKDYVAGERPFVQVGFTGDKDKFRKEGEKWKDTKGIEWQKVNGKLVRLTKTQGDIIREAIGDTLSCKECGAQWKWCSAKDRKLIARTSVCMDCLAEYETKLRILGIYDAYEKYRLAIYEVGHLKEVKLKIIETIEYLSRTGGDATTIPESEYDEAIVWKNTNKDKLVENAEADLKKIEELLEKSGPIVAEIKSKYLEGINKYNFKDIVTKE